jgi:hypothetical protein
MRRSAAIKTRPAPIPKGLAALESSQVVSLQDHPAVSGQPTQEAKPAAGAAGATGATGHPATGPMATKSSLTAAATPPAPPIKKTIEQWLATYSFDDEKFIDPNPLATRLSYTLESKGLEGLYVGQIGPGGEIGDVVQDKSLNYILVLGTQSKINPKTLIGDNVGIDEKWFIMDAYPHENDASAKKPFTILKNTASDFARHGGMSNEKMLDAFETLKQVPLTEEQFKQNMTHILGKNGELILCFNITKIKQETGYDVARALLPFNPQVTVRTLLRVMPTGANPPGGDAAAPSSKPPAGATMPGASPAKAPPPPAL